jgi:hypothetical protein
MSAFRSYTSKIPMAESTTVLIDPWEGFANTVTDKLAMAKAFKARFNGLTKLLVAWPGEYNTHVFSVPADDVISALQPEPAIAVGDLVRVTAGFCNAKAGMIGVVRIIDNGELGIEFADFVDGHSLDSTLRGTRARAGQWVPPKDVVRA